MATTEKIILQITAETNKALAGLRKTNQQLAQTQKANTSLSKSFSNAQSSILGVVAVAGTLIAGFKKLVDITEKQVQAELQLDAVLKSTENAAGLTADEIKNMASSLQQVTTYGDETILQGQNLLLTFTKIGKDVFPAATEIMLDMSTALGQDLKQSAIQLGKALQDPVLGITNLRRVGVQLSASQEAQIKQFMKVNDVAGAQKIILGELATQFGGSARAAAQSFAGQMKQLANRMGDLAEIFGKEVLPELGKLVKDMFSAGDGSEDFIKSIAKVVSSLLAMVRVFVNAANMLVRFNPVKVIAEAGDDLAAGKNPFDRLAADSSVMWDKLKGSAESFTNVIGITKTVQDELANSTNNHASEVAKLKEELKKTGEAGNTAGNLNKEAIKKQQDALKQFNEMKMTELEQERVKLEEQREFIVENAGLQAEELAELDLLVKERELEIEEEHQQKLRNMRLQTAQIGMQQAQQMTQTIGQIMAVASKVEEKRLDKDYKKKKFFIDALVKDETQKAQLLEWLDFVTNRKKMQAAREAAIQKKAIGIVEATIGTALAVTNALQTQPFMPLGIIMAALAAAMGAAQIGIIAAAPLAEGGVIPGSSAGTFIQAGEGGRAEAILPLESEEAQEKLGGQVGGNTVHIHMESAIVTNANLPDEFMTAIDRGLFTLMQDSNSVFAEAIRGE